MLERSIYLTDEPILARNPFLASPFSNFCRAPIQHLQADLGGLPESLHHLGHSGPVGVRKTAEGT